jgi:membrane protein YdbS with pleckstrin-like domain
MAFPGRLLNEGERVGVDTRPHPWILAGPILIAAVAVVVAAAAAALNPPTAVAWVLVGVVVLALANLLVRWLRWRATRLVVTTERIIRRSGVLSRSGREIPLAALSDLTYHQSALQRVIGAGDLLLQSAGRESTEVVRSVPRPALIQNEIYRLRSLAGSGVPGTPRGLTLPEQLEKLDELRRRGVLSDAEFQVTKSRLLSGS